MQYLRLATVARITVGPFLDETDGHTPETGLAITQGDIRLIKPGGNFAQVAAPQTLPHEENGWYGPLTLTAVDTDTLGTLILAINKSGALPVWQECYVLPTQVFDSLFAGTDLLDVTTVTGTGGGSSGSSGSAVGGVSPPPAPAAVPSLSASGLRSSATEVTLCNSALTQLGHITIQSFDDGTPTATLCREEFPKARDIVLELHPWNFATFYATLARLADAPAWGWTHQYMLQTVPYCIRVLEMRDNRPFEVAAYMHQGNPARCFLTHEATAAVRFIGQVDDLSRWNTLALEALTMLLVKILALAITGQQGKRAAAIQEVKEWLAVAGDRDAREGTPHSVSPNRLLSAIRHRTTSFNPERTSGGYPWS